MKKNLLKAAVVAISVMMCGSAWADTTATFSPTAEYSIRTNSSEAYVSGYPKAASSQATFEVNHASYFCAVQQYTISDLAAVKSVSLAVANGKGSDALAIWVLPKDNTWSSTMTAADFVTLYETTTGMKPGVAGTATDTYLLKNDVTTKTSDSDPYNHFTLDLTKLKANASDAGVVTLLITNKTAQMTTSSTQRQYLSSNEANTNKPVLTVTYAPVYNVTTGAQYTGLKAAVDAAAANNEIKVMEDQSLSARVDIANVMTIDGNSKTITINQKTASGFLIKAGATIKNATIAGADGGKAVFEFANSTDKTNFAPTIENVTVNNANVANQGVYRIKDYAQVTLKNVVNSGITVTDGYAEIFLASAAQTTACKLDGTNTVASVYFEAGKRLYVNGATISSPIALTFASAYTIPTACVIQGSKTTTDFTVTNDGYAMYVSKNNGGANNEMGIMNTKATSYTLTVTAAGASTLMLPFDASLPETGNFKAYTLSYKEGDYATATVATSLTANTPYYVTAEAGDYTFTGTEASYTEDSYTEGALTGLYKAQTLTYSITTPYYVLSNEASGVGFYKANDTTVNPFRAYLRPVNDDDAVVVEAKPFIGIDFGGATAINDVDANTSTSSAQAQGKFIQNGKLVIVKNGKQYNAAGQQMK